MIVRSGPFPSSSINTQQNQKADKKDVQNIKEDKVNETSSSTDNVNYADEIDNSQKVQNIKEQIDNGTYKIDINKSADKMAQDLLLEVKVYK
ncbi:MAG: flagellar biosynthesis anti-sigma factor FlgM [Helicobacteraceae bacterium]|nr:flagellar biosynthesis anti-sigma factor FlgM [Helicobacteraceae bacterium]